MVAGYMRLVASCVLRASQAPRRGLPLPTQPPKSPVISSRPTALLIEDPIDEGSTIFHLSAAVGLRGLPR